MRHYDAVEHINVGTGVDLTIRELAEMVRGIVYPQAELVFDASKPDGTPKKLLDVSRLHALGWRHKIELREGIESSYRSFLAHHDEARGAGDADRARAVPRHPGKERDPWPSS